MSAIFPNTLRTLLAIVLGLGIFSIPAAAQPAIGSIAIKWRSDVEPDATSPLADDLRSALHDAMRMPVVQVGRARDGAVLFDLSVPLSLDGARATLNRVRMLPQVLYANAVESSATAGKQKDQTTPGSQGPVRRLIVKYRDPAITEGARNNEPLSPLLVDALSSVAGQPLAQERAMAGGAFVLRFFRNLPGEQAQALAQLLEADASIEYAEPDILLQPTLTPNDPNYTSQWHYQSPPQEMGGVNLPPAWNITTGSASIFIGVIDTGILPHPDLIGRYSGGYDMISDPQVANDGDGRDPDPSDPGDWITAADASGYFQGCPTSNSSWHGTHVSGTIAAATNNAIGVAGINWTSKVLPVRVLGKCGGYMSDIIDAIVWAAGGSVPAVPANPTPARVLNLSLGGTASCSTATQDAINAALAAGAVVAVAAGNSNTDASQSTPGNCNGVITVAATGRLGQRAPYSNYGALVEISAPGGADGQYVLSTLNNGTTSPTPSGYIYAYYQGTSMATPHVAGIASLMLSVNPALTPAQVLSMIQTTARAFPTGTGRDCSTALCGAGIIDAGAAVAAAAATVQQPTTTQLASSANPALAGAAVTFTATVTGSNNPTGSVNFSDGGGSIAGCAAVALVGSGNTKTAACSTNGLAIGTHSIVANYGGDAANAGSSSAALSQVVNVSGSGLSNGGFEVPNLSGGFQYSPSGASWVFTNGGGIAGNGNGFTAGNPPAPEGVQVTFLQDQGVASQTASIAAGQYTLSFKAAQRGNYQVGTQVVKVQVDGVTVGQYQPPSSAYSSYQTTPFTIATTGNHTVTLAGVGSGSDYTALVDDVQLTVMTATGAFSDGGFEVPNLGGGFQYSPSGASWVFTNGGGIAGNGNGFTVGNPPAPEGVQVAFLQGQGVASQTASIAAGQYTLSFKAAQRGNYEVGTQVVQVQVDGVTVGQYQPPSSAYSSYQTPPFTIAASGNHTVTLAGIGSGTDYTALVDDVRLTTATTGGFANGGFETPNLGGGFQYSPSGASWVFSNGGGIAGNGNGFTAGNPPAPEGVQVAFLQDQGVATQTASIAAGQYTLSFKAAQRGNYEVGTQVVQVQVDGVTVGQYQPPSSAYSSYQTPPFTIAATGDHSVTIAGVGSGSDYTAFVDDVRLTSQ